MTISTYIDFTKEQREHATTFCPSSHDNCCSNIIRPLSCGKHIFFKLSFESNH